MHSDHGANRIRDSKVLAQNAIVVTTYATLSSDSNYHAKKAGADFCPPCEQIRWWRIICDESHALKDGNTQTSKAIRSIDAEIKW
jgi:SNF2 family DNA or RNA helicase